MKLQDPYLFFPPPPDYDELAKEVLAPLALDVQLRAEWFLKKKKEKKKTNQ